eukprot:COSAG01_NODE_2255_length_8070_cov_25.147786_17_plen_59_part_00
MTLQWRNDFLAIATSCMQHGQMHGGWPWRMADGGMAHHTQEIGSLLPVLAPAGTRYRL